MVELGLVSRQALALGAKLGFQARELGLRDQRLDSVPPGPAVSWAHAEHLPAPPCYRRGDPAGGARRADDGELVHRLEKVRVGGRERFLHGDASGKAERKLGAVDAMIAAVD